jgi:hypothetical protein
MTNIITHLQQASVKRQGRKSREMAQDDRSDPKAVFGPQNRLDEVTGAPPAGEQLAFPGKTFRMIKIDIQSIKHVKISKTYHMKNWPSAVCRISELALQRSHLMPGWVEADFAG